MVIGMRAPWRATQGPVTMEATISPAAIGRKVTAVSYAEAFTTTWRYRAVKKKIEKVPKYAAKATKTEPEKGACGTARNRGWGVRTRCST